MLTQCSLVGGPSVEPFQLGSHAPGLLSPSMLRYLKQVSDIEWFFGLGPFQQVVEIGGGYGGLAALIATRFKVAHYTIYDLPEAQALAQLHLNEIALPSGVRFHFPPLPNVTHWRRTVRSAPWPPRYDLCISSYALSELSEDALRAYMVKVLAFCQRAVIHWNDFAVGLGRFLPELIDLLTLPIRILPDIPVSGPTNCILLWGEKDASVRTWTQETMRIPIALRVPAEMKKTPVYR